MVLPTDLMRYLDVTLVSGSPLPATLANGATISAGVQNVTFGALGRNPISISGRFSDYTDQGKVLDMDVTLAVRSAYATLLASVGAVLGFSLTEPLYSPGVPLAVAGPNRNPKGWTTELTGLVLRRERDDYNRDQGDAVRTVQIPLRVQTYIETVEDQTQQLYNWNWLTQTFVTRGVNIFTGETVT